MVAFPVSNQINKPANIALKRIKTVQPKSLAKSSAPWYQTTPSAYCQFLLLKNMDNYHLTHKDGKWNLKKEGSDRAIKTFKVKQEAVDYSTEYMREHQGSLKIHKEDGKIQEERTYPRSADPKQSKG